MLLERWTVMVGPVVRIQVTTMVAVVVWMKSQKRRRLKKIATAPFGTNMDVFESVVIRGDKYPEDKYYFFCILWNKFIYLFRYKIILYNFCLDICPFNFFVIFYMSSIHTLFFKFC